MVTWRTGGEWRRAIARPRGRISRCLSSARLGYPRRRPDVLLQPRSSFLAILGAMPNADYLDSLAGDAIDNHVGPNSSKFPRVSIRTRPTSMRESCQIIGGLHQIIGHAHSGARIESGDVSGVLRQIAQRAVSPNDKGQGLMVVDNGGGASNSPLASFLSHSRTISCGTTRPASMSAMPSSIARRLTSSSTRSNMETMFAIPVI